MASKVNFSENQGNTDSKKYTLTPHKVEITFLIEQ